MSDDDALTTLYHRHAHEVHVRLYAHCGDAADARDAVQEAFLRLGHALAAGQAVRQPAGWLVTVGRRWLCDQHRRNGRGHSSDALDTRASDQPQPLAGLLSGEMREQVRAALAALPPGEREPLVMKYTLDLSSREIAARLGLTAAAVDMRLTRARRRLAETLRAVGADP